jgi:hypothetical protein
MKAVKATPAQSCSYPADCYNGSGCLFARQIVINHDPPNSSILQGLWIQAIYRLTKTETKKERRFGSSSLMTLTAKKDDDRLAPNRVSLRMGPDHL